MKKHSISLIIFVISILAITALATASAEAPSATIIPDKGYNGDYTPDQQVTLFGSNFSPNAPVTITVTTPDGTNVPISEITADDTGSFTATYGPPLTFGIYTVIATDGTNTAYTQFTDGININSVDVSAQNPDPISAGNSATYTVTIRLVGNNQPQTFDLSVTTTLPTGATASFSIPTISATDAGLYTSTLTIQTDSGTPAGTFPFTVQATHHDTGTSKTGDGVLDITPGSVLPEYPLAGLAAVFSCFGAFVLFKKRSGLHL